MLEKLPHAVGVALSGLKAGLDTTAYHQDFGSVPETISLTSPAFADGASLPARFTADGPGVSPPLSWSGLPAGTSRVVLLVEDAGSPTPKPLVHLIAWNLAASESLPEGALASAAGEGSQHDLGQNSFLKDQWLPPDPPTGHGPHTYLFQIYALDAPLDLPASPGRAALIEAMTGRVLAKGCLTGLYERR
ncbi:YbhB/YbcL family Raf kinase inhibitor-like protein [Methylobacterium sp. Leaf93]|uniref:YbhB/YbcL family Raf kinase inhibitor-like protein n=1 Tax=Methylobacterium sp. Leaf93 TaxID=1736249 RepID=UPI0006FAFEA0|nr:YbhB/YbcL family Raf kinase inhibitor-like protein [Methylobacterium sp. Leaf93]KQP11754.1 phosphatidylethanolamine-binding protein [Methylobacterium sp. Leaf93]